MNRRLTGRFWVEAVLAGISAALAVLTAVWPTWIEGLLEVEPDAGSGATEWWVVLVLAGAALVLTMLARIEFRRVIPTS